MIDTRGARLLIVDDEAAQMTALCHTLEDNGYLVRGCGSGSAALLVLREESFDLMLCDLRMPGMDGITLLRAAQAIDPMLAGVIMTGEGTIGTAVEAMRSGALDYVLKPFKVSAILPVLTRSLAMRRLRLENADLERRVREHTIELEATNRELDAFTRSASHDLRAPLNAILGFSTLLKNEASPGLTPEQQRWLNYVEVSARGMSDLIDALMRLSYVGRRALQIRTVDPRAVLDGVIADLRAAQAQREIVWEIGTLPEVQADEALLKQVLVNLLSNAIKFTRKTTRAVIAVGCEAQGQTRTFFVRDNGAGFDMARAERLFEAFERYHPSEQYEGSGVGLSIVHRIVQRHGGKVWAKALPGQGATFYFTLGAGGPAAGSA